VTTLAQVKRVTRALLDRNSDLALVSGRLVVVKPVRHLLRGVFISSRGPIIHLPVWFVTFLFKPGAVPDDRWGERLFRKWGAKRSADDPPEVHLEHIRMLSAITRLPVHEQRYPDDWPAWVDHHPTIVTEMCEVIEEQALPMLRPLQSIDDFVAFTADQTRFPWTWLGPGDFNEPFIFAAQGNFEAALAACIKLVAEEPRPAIKELHRLLAGGDRHGVAQLLHGWEADSVKRLKLEEYWEPTSFPIEAIA
jgi:hypothetical protein